MSLPNMLGPQELAFVDEYVRTLNATQSYIAAYNYTGNNARVLGWRVLQRSAVQAAIEVRRVQVAGELDVTPGRVMERAAQIAFADPRMIRDKDGKLLQLQELPDEVAFAVERIRVIKKTTYGTPDAGVTIEFVEYRLRNPEGLIKYLGDVIGLGKFKDVKELSDLSLEELEGLAEANDEACRAIQAASDRAKKITSGVVKKVTAKIMAEAADKPNGNGKSNGNGAAKANGKKKPNGNGSVH